MAPEPDANGSSSLDPDEEKLKSETAAWHLEQRVHITNVAHLVAQHRHRPT